MNPPDQGLRDLYRIAALATLIMLVVIPAQIIVFLITPIPTSPAGWLTLMAERPAIGLFHADFFLMINNLLIAVIYLAFYHSLKHTNRGVLQIAIVLGLVGIAAYISSNRTFELLALAREAAVETDADARRILLAATRAMLAGWQGTAFDVYYVLNGITLVVVSALMLREPLYGRTTAVIGLLAGFFMAVPSTVGTLGLVFSLLSLIPWILFSIRYRRVWGCPVSVDTKLRGCRSGSRSPRGSDSPGWSVSVGGCRRSP